MTHNTLFTIAWLLLPFVCDHYGIPLDVGVRCLRAVELLVPPLLRAVRSWTARGRPPSGR